jgi:thiamine-phosphate pyrophosphorylase
MKRRFDPSLYLILDLSLMKSRSLDPLVAAAVAGGVTMVQLRGKGVAARDLGLVGAHLKSLLAPHHVPLIVNDDVAVAMAIGADGVHLGPDDLPPAAARTLLGDRALIGISVGTPAEAAAADATNVDYVSVGPVFATKTKSDAGPAIGIDGFSDVRSLFPNLPAIAIGGITPDKVTPIIRACAAGLAVASALCCAEDPASVAQHFRERITTAFRLGAA